jgi:hypothetical protein
MSLRQVLRDAEDESTRKRHMPVRRSVRGLTLLTTLALTAGVIVAPAALVGGQAGAAPASAKARPVAAKRVVLDLSAASLEVVGRAQGAAKAAAAGRRWTATTPPQAVPQPLGVVGAVWDGNSVSDGDALQIRVLKDTTWSSWQDLDREDDHAPDVDGPDGVEGRSARHGTAPYVVEGKQAQVRLITGGATAPKGLKVMFIDPGTSSGDAAVGKAAAGAGASASAAAARPTIYTRRDWGADESMRRDGPYYGQAHVAFVHHTDGTNSYTSSQVPGIIRGIYDYHVNGQGWSDIGYNFLVDRFGRTWEGRYGGVDKAVIGAHTMNYNSWSFGVSAIGDFSVASPPAAMVGAIEKVIAWKFTLHGDPATGTVYARDKYFNRISGHRDGYSTACPGQRLYDLLPSIRSHVAGLVGQQRQQGVSRSVDGGGTGDLLDYGGTLTPPTMSGPPDALRLSSPQGIKAARQVGTAWNGLRNVTLTPDLTGDGRADVIAQDPNADGLRIYAGDGKGGFSRVLRRGTGWNGIVSLVAGGDRDGDGHNDLLGVMGDGQLYLYPGDGRGWLKTRKLIGTGWDVLKTTVSAGDVDGDGSPDLVAVRTSDGALLRYAGRPDGSIGAKTTWGTGWGGFTALAAGPDADGDGQAGDLVVRSSDGRMRSYFAEPRTARLTRTNVWGSGWGGMGSISSGADLDGDGRSDLLGISPTQSDGALWLYSGSGERDFSAPALPVTPDVAGADWVRLVGDVDGDGRADALARKVDGTLLGLRGTGGGSFAAPVVIGSGWQVFDLVETAGDLSHDGVPDLLARTPDGQLRVYAMSRTFGFSWRIDMGTGWQAMRSVTGVGGMNTDFNGDVVALRASDGALVFYRGSGPGALLEGTVMRAGQTDLVQLMGLGDVNGDGLNDVVARDVQGALWLYAGNGNGSLLPGRQPMRSPVTRVLG